MGQYIIRRLIQSVFILVGVSIFVFLIIHLTPGSITTNVIDPSMSAAEKSRIEEKFGLNQSIPEQYISWVSEVLKGNFGYSVVYCDRVKNVIQKHMWNTFYLSLFGMVISLLVGIPAGVLSSIKQYSKTDIFFTIFALIGISIPSFFFGILLIKVFAIDLTIFPTSGMLTPGSYFTFPSNLLDVLWHTVLPGVVLGLGSTASIMRYTRASMLEIIKQDYIRTARSKGLKERVVIYKHALRNALIPIITILGFWIPRLFSGAVIVEHIFGWPGMGKMGLTAILSRDYPLIMGVNMFLSILVLIGNLMADIFYAIADPRIRYN